MLMRIIAIAFAVVTISGTSFTRAADVYRVVVMTSSPGAFASLSEQLTIGSKRAVAALNSSGGIRGKKIELIVLDDRCDPPVAADLARRAIDEYKANLIIGHLCYSASRAADAVYESKNAITINPAASSSPNQIQLKNRNSFILAPRSVIAIAVAVSTALQQSTKSITVVSDTAEWAKALEDTTKSMTSDAALPRSVQIGELARLPTSADTVLYKGSNEGLLSTINTMRPSTVVAIELNLKHPLALRAPDTLLSDRIPSDLSPESVSNLKQDLAKALKDSAIEATPLL
ncbi:MAG: ABC transporter substrate-binding protein [Hyphomicrobiaceae bacterium]